MKTVFRRVASQLKARQQLLLSLAILLFAGAVSWQIVQRAHHTLTYAPQSLAECQKAATKDYKCYAKYYAVLTYSQGTAAALKDMEAAYNTDEYVKAECHQLTHIVGRTAFERSGSLEKAYSEGDIFCWSGFYHGAIEHAIKRLGAENVKQNAADICESFANKERYSLKHFNCVHGLGHGLMAVASYNLFDGLKLCDSIKTDWEQQSCYGGVFMENVMVSFRGNGTGAYLDPSRPLYPCTAVATTYKESCYLIQSSYVLQHNGSDFGRTFWECARADADFVHTCYQSVGRDALGSAIDIPRTITSCQAAPADANHDDAVSYCMHGAIRQYLTYYHDQNVARQLCAGFGGELQATCDVEVTQKFGAS